MNSKSTLRNIVFGCIIFITQASLSGCGVLIKETEDPLKSTGRVTTTGAHQLFNEDSFEKVNLPDLLDPDKKRDDVTPLITTNNSENKTDNLERAFDAFYKYPNKEQRRNRVQDRLLAASEQRCNLYKNYLKRVETYQSTTFGMLTTVLAGAGAIATGSVNTRAFSGLASISSGMGAELKEGFFANLASQVIIPGIELRRDEIWKTVILSKRNTLISNYTVEAAIRDVALYHGACSLIVGLEAAGVATKTFSNPGLDSINTTLSKLRLSHSLADNLRDPISAPASLKELQTIQSSATAGLSPFQLYPTVDMPLSLLAALTENIDAELSNLIGKVRTQKSNNDKLIGDKSTAQDKKDAASTANIYFNELLNSADSGSLEKQRQDALEKLNTLQKDFGEANGKLADLTTKLDSATNDDKVAIQGEINTQQNVFRAKKMLPTQIYADKLITQISLAESSVQSNNSTKLEGILTTLKAVIDAGVTSP